MKNKNTKKIIIAGTFAFFRGMVGQEIFENEMKGKIHKTYFQFFFPLEIKNKSLEILEIKKLVMFL